jgi:hypothetical protein
MAIRTDDAVTHNEALGASSADAQTHATAGQSNQHQAQPQRARSISDLNSKFRGFQSTRTSGESITRYLDAIRTDIATTGEDMGRKVLSAQPIDPAQLHLALGGVALCIRLDNLVVVHTLLVESSGMGRIPARTFQLGGGRTAVVDGVAGDAYDNHYWTVLSDHLRKSFGENTDFRDAGCSVIPTEVTPDHKAEIHSLVAEATNALYYAQAKAQNPESLVVSANDFLTGEPLVANVEVNTGDVQNAAGHVVRTDVKINVDAMLKTGEAVSAIQNMPISQVGGFVDLVYTPHPSQIAMANAWASTNPNSVYSAVTYTPRFVITTMDTAFDVTTLELELLALATSTLMSNDNAWVELFYNKMPSGDDIDLRDIGAIGYQVNFSGASDWKGAKIDTKGDNFSVNDFRQMMASAFNQELIYSQDIPETGEKSWIQSIFIAAARGDQAAAQAILKAANNLTGGVFAQRYQGANNPVMGDITRIHLGQFETKSGIKDIRSCDNLAMLNMMGGSDMAVVVDYMRTFDDPTEAPEVKLERRAKYIRGTFCDNPRITGYANRITYNPNFISALVESLGACGMKFSQQNTFMSNNGVTYQGNAGAAAMAVGAGQIGGVWGHQGPGNFQGNQQAAWGVRMPGNYYNY